MNSHKGEPFSLSQNPQNGVMMMGHSYGGVSLWTPNYGKAVVQILCHPSSPINTISHSKDGNYFVTTANDSKMKVWDLRTFKELHSYFTPAPATATSIS